MRTDAGEGRIGNPKGWGLEFGSDRVGQETEGGREREIDRGVVWGGRNGGHVWR